MKLNEGRGQRWSILYGPQKCRDRTQIGECAEFREFIVMRACGSARRFISIAFRFQLHISITRECHVLLNYSYLVASTLDFGHCDIYHSFWFCGTRVRLEFVQNINIKKSIRQSASCITISNFSPKQRVDFLLFFVVVVVAVICLTSTNQNNTRICRRHGKTEIAYKINHNFIWARTEITGINYIYYWFVVCCCCCCALWYENCASASTWIDWIWYSS